MEKNIDIRNIVKSFPIEPGVYIMKDVNDKVIYIGKAKNLKRRVSSYFNKNIPEHSKVAKLVFKISKIDYIVTDSELEALILECNLIKKYKPMYNILLKDDKGYKFIKISTGPYSKISVANKKGKDKSIYIGPYISNFSTKQIVDIVNKTFKLATCKKDFNNIKQYNRPCLNYYINLCSAPCCKKISEEEYKKNIENAVKYLKSGMKQTIKELKGEMKEASLNLNYEEAAKIRDQIKIIEKVNYSDKVMTDKYKNMDVLAVIENQGFICGTLLIFRDYKLIDKKQYIVDSDEELPNVRKVILMKNQCNKTLKNPEAIYLDGPVQDFELIKNYLFQDVKVILPNKKNKIIEMAKNNSIERITQELKLIDKDMLNVNKLKELLNIKSARIIEAYDISNFGSNTIVGGMVLVVDGKCQKSGYKMFKIKDVNQQDDYKSMVEIIERRINRYNQGDDTNNFNVLPDLILIDGGYNHISVVNEVMKKYKLNIPIYGMVKNNKHITENLIGLENKQIDIKNNDDLFLFIKRIQDEVHRFTINYSRKSHSKNSIKSDLMGVPGVGPARRKMLISHFKSIENIENASLEEIEKVEGIPKFVAKTIFDYFKK